MGLATRKQIQQVKTSGRGSRYSRSRRSSSHIRCFGCGGSGHVVARCPSVAAKVVAAKRQEQVSDTQSMSSWCPEDKSSCGSTQMVAVGSHAGSVMKKKKIICYKCRRYGHVARRCP